MTDVGTLPTYTSATGRSAAYAAGDALILARSALNATSIDTTEPISELAHQSPGSAYQYTVDALRAVFRELLSGLPEAAVELAVQYSLDMTGEYAVTQRIEAYVRHNAALLDPELLDHSASTEAPPHGVRGVSE